MSSKVRVVCGEITVAEDDKKRMVEEATVFFYGAKPSEAFLESNILGLTEASLQFERGDTYVYYVECHLQGQIKKSLEGMERLLNAKDPEEFNPRP